VAAAKPRPRPATDRIWAELLDAAPPRERLMARLAGEAGLRRAEVALVHRDDLIDELAGPSLIVRGKGGKQRIVPLTSALADAIRRHEGDGYLFVGQIDGHISPGHVGVLLSRLMPTGWSMHKLRHRYATRGYAGTGNLRAVQEALGHASVATTQRYVAVSSMELRSVSEAAAA
jgi:integrase